MNWKHGYYAESGYTYGYYPETLPLRLRWAALMQGHRAPVERFRYLDAGCGQGLNLLLAAAAHPHSEFVGVDFLPEHIAHARGLAEKAGLRNVTFVEADFVSLAAQPQTLGEFDYAVCHGISTWISPTVKQALFQWVGRVLKPGGVFYNSYNTYPGWLGVAPFQHLVLLEQQRGLAGGAAIQSARKYLDVLKQAGTGMLNALPGLQARLATMDGQDASYLVQEYNNTYWQPVFVSQMMEALASVKLQYLGTATLPDAIDATLPPAVQNLLREQPTVALREQLRDYALNQAFRRDLYVKGTLKPWPQELLREVRQTRLVLNTSAQRPAAGQPFPIKGGTVEFSGDATFYGGILDRLAANAETGLSVGELIDSEAESQRGAVVQALSLMLHANWVYLDQGDGAVGNAGALNRALAAAAVDGAPYRFVGLPRCGGATVLNDVDWQVLHRALLHESGPVAHSAPDMNLWAVQIAEGMARLGRAIGQNGQPVTDPDALHGLLKSAAQEFLKVKWPFLKRMGGA